MADKQPTVLFLHVPKTAGLTMRQVLVRNYRSSSIVRNKPERKRGEKGGERLARVIRGEEAPRPDATRGVDRNKGMKRTIASLSDRDRADTRLVMGHFWFGLHESFDQPCTYITILRSPVERVLSLFNHRLTQHGLAIDVESYVRSERDMAMDNEQTRRLIGVLPDDDIRRVTLDDSMLEIAKRNLRERFTVAGLTERFDESLVLMAQRFGWTKISYTRENVAKKRVRRSDLQPEVVAMIEDHNRYDAQLYAYAAEVLDEQLRALPDLDERVTSLREENARLEKVRSIPLVDRFLQMRNPERRPALRDVVAKVTGRSQPPS